jgi:hypothetical protein
VTDRAGILPAWHARSVTGQRYLPIPLTDTFLTPSDTFAG